jgi:hypothetical protein
MADLVMHTSNCVQHDHPEFRIVYNTDLVTEEDLQYLIGALEESVAGGNRFEQGTRFQVGWVVTRMRAADGGTLAIQEPDMTHTPAWWIDSVNHSLIHRRLQRGVCSSLEGVSGPDFPSSEQTAVICDRFGDTEGFAMWREEAEAPDSGWRFGCGAPDHDHSGMSSSSRLPLFEIAVGYEPRVIPYLALPPGVSVANRPQGPVFALRGESLDIKSGSLLAHNFPGI